MITWTQLRLQDACSPLIEELIFFHDFTIVILTFIIRIVGFSLVRTTVNLFMCSNIIERQLLECVWTIIPAIILVVIAAPSLALLYIIDETSNSSIRVKVVGHQWYWSYEYSDFWANDVPHEFDSYIVKPASSQEPFRLLEVDSRTVVPGETSVRFLVRSSDVLHSWAVPSAGLKVDACPGRLNQVKFLSHRPGLYFGQCSEICGANHSFMPICLEVVRPLGFLSWITRDFEVSLGYTFQRRTKFGIGNFITRENLLPVFF